MGLSVECGNKADYPSGRGWSGTRWDGMGQPLRGKWEQLTELTAKLADQRTKVNFHPPYQQLDICIVFMVGLDGMDEYSALHGHGSCDSYSVTSAALFFFVTLTIVYLLSLYTK